MFLGKYICELEIAHPNGNKIRNFLSIKELTVKLRTARANFQKAKALNKPAKIAIAEKKLTILQNKFQKKIKKYDSLKVKDGQNADVSCEAAFVVFDNEESYIRCLIDYGRYYNWLKRNLFQPKVFNTLIYLYTYIRVYV